MAPPRRRSLRGLWWVLLALGLVAAAWSTWEWRRWPDVARLARENPSTTAFIEAWRARQRAAGKSDRVEWRWVPYERISPNFKRAVLVAEDIEFFSHHGFAFGEIETALAEAWQEKALPRGASTVSQQLAKNLWLSASRNPLRKWKEALLTRELERRLSKRRILELYLNVVELGSGCFGVEAGARRYFGHGASELSEEEAAALAAALPRPRDWHPGSASRVYKRRVEIVLGRMARAQFLRREI